MKEEQKPKEEMNMGMGNMPQMQQMPYTSPMPYMSPMPMICCPLLMNMQCPMMYNQPMMGTNSPTMTSPYTANPMMTSPYMGNASMGMQY